MIKHIEPKLIYDKSFLIWNYKASLVFLFK